MNTLHSDQHIIKAKINEFKETKQTFTALRTSLGVLANLYGMREMQNFFVIPQMLFGMFLLHLFKI